MQFFITGNVAGSHDLVPTTTDPFYPKSCRILSIQFFSKFHQKKSWKCPKLSIDFKILSNTASIHNEKVMSTTTTCALISKKKNQKLSGYWEKINIVDCFFRTKISILLQIISKNSMHAKNFYRRLYCRVNKFREYPLQAPLKNIVECILHAAIMQQSCSNYAANQIKSPKSAANQSESPKNAEIMQQTKIKLRIMQQKWTKFKLRHMHELVKIKYYR